MYVIMGQVINVLIVIFVRYKVKFNKPTTFIPSLLCHDFLLLLVLMQKKLKVIQKQER